MIEKIFGDTFFTDMLGQKVRIGDYIVYPGRRGSSCWQNIGRVLRMKNQAHRWRDNHFTATVKVLSANQNWRTQQWEANDKAGYITRLDRVVKIDSIGEELRAILAK